MRYGKTDIADLRSTNNGENYQLINLIRKESLYSGFSHWRPGLKSNVKSEANHHEAKHLGKNIHRFSSLFHQENNCSNQTAYYGSGLHTATREYLKTQSCT